MSKHDHGSFRFKVDGLRLAPATAHDQEMLATYRNGSEVSAIISQPKNDRLLRKYWAIIGRVLKDCPTPWKDKDQASEALKLALGIVRYGKTISGKYMQWPRSLAEMDAPEFERFFEDAMALLSEITGVDVETLKAESADVGEDNHESSEASPRPDVESGTDNPAPSDGPALDHSEDQAELPMDALPADKKAQLTEEDYGWLLDTARMLWAATEHGKGDILENQFKGVGSKIPAFVSDAAMGLGTGILETCRKVCAGKMDSALALKFVANAAGCTEQEVVP